VDPATQMVIDGQQAFGMISVVLWTMLRIGAMLMTMPLIGTRAVPKRIRALLAGTLAVAIAPLLPPPPPGAGLDAVTVLGVMKELALGIMMGFTLRLIFEAGAFAGEMVSHSMGLAFAQMSDPLRGSSSGVVGQWFYLAFGLLFFTSDGHLVLLGLLVRSYQTLPIGSAWPDAIGLIGQVPELLTLVLRCGLVLALPVMVAILASNLSFGVLARAAPALHPMQLGLPVSLLLGLFLLAGLASQVATPVLDLFTEAFAAITRITGG
jgi:flagellar biosynthetic protein FliR